MEKTYFESGKITSQSFRLFLFSSIILIIFLLDEEKSLLTLPFIKLKLDYSSALIVMFFLHVAFFFRFMSAVNYERELRGYIKHKNKYNTKDTWSISYPSLINFQQFSPKAMQVSDHKTLKSIFFIQLLFCGMILPIWAAGQLFIIVYADPFSNLGLLFLNSVCCTFTVLTIIALMRAGKTDRTPVYIPKNKA